MANRIQLTVFIGDTQTNNIVAKKTLVEVRVPVMSKEDPSVPKVTDDNRKDVIFKNEQFYLLHWGTQTEFEYESEDPSRVLLAWSYTVGICQGIATGLVHTFMPTEIKILGTVYVDDEYKSKIKKR